MKIVPVSFGKEHKAMLGHCKMILENEGGGRIASATIYVANVASKLTVGSVDGKKSWFTDDITKSIKTDDRCYSLLI